MSTTNPYCEALGIQVPRLEVAKNSVVAFSHAMQPGVEQYAAARGSVKTLVSLPAKMQHIETMACPSWLPADRIRPRDAAA